MDLRLIDNRNELIDSHGLFRWVRDGVRDLANWKVMYRVLRGNGNTIGMIMILRLVSQREWKLEYTFWNHFDAFGNCYYSWLERPTINGYFYLARWRPGFFKDHPQKPKFEIIIFTITVQLLSSGRSWLWIALFTVLTWNRHKLHIYIALSFTINRWRELDIYC